MGGHAFFLTWLVGSFWHSRMCVMSETLPHFYPQRKYTTATDWVIEVVFTIHRLYTFRWGCRKYHPIFFADRRKSLQLSSGAYNAGT